MRFEFLFVIMLAIELTNLFLVVYDLQIDNLIIQ